MHLEKKIGVPKCSQHVLFLLGILTIFAEKTILTRVSHRLQLGNISRWWSRWIVYSLNASPKFILSRGNRLPQSISRNVALRGIEPLSAAFFLLGLVKVWEYWKCRNRQKKHSSRSSRVLMMIGHRFHFNSSTWFSSTWNGLFSLCALVKYSCVED